MASLGFGGGRKRFSRCNCVCSLIAVVGLVSCALKRHRVHVSSAMSNSSVVGAGDDAGARHMSLSDDGDPAGPGSPTPYRDTPRTSGLSPRRGHAVALGRGAVATLHSSAAIDDSRSHPDLDSNQLGHAPGNIAARCFAWTHAAATTRRAHAGRAQPPLRGGNNLAELSTQ